MGTRNEPGRIPACPQGLRTQGIQSHGSTSLPTDTQGRKTQLYQTLQLFQGNNGISWIIPLQKEETPAIPNSGGKQRISASLLVFLGFFFPPFLSSWEPPGTSQALSLSGSRGGKGRQGIPRLSASPGCPNSKEIINRAEGGAQGGYGLSHPIPAGKTLLQRDQAGQGSRSLPFPALGAVGGKGREGSRIITHTTATSSPFPDVFGISRCPTHLFLHTRVVLCSPAARASSTNLWNGKGKSRSSSKAAQPWNSSCWKHQECSPAHRHSQRSLIRWEGLFSRLVLPNSPG